jgi:hypothetical protein
MMCFIHWISAKRRLKEVQKTVTMLADGKFTEKGVPPMVLAQRDFIKKEVEYFEEESVNLLFKLFFLFWICVVSGLFYFGANR